MATGYELSDDEIDEVEMEPQMEDLLQKWQQHVFEVIQLYGPLARLTTASDHDKHTWLGCLECEQIRTQRDPTKLVCAYHQGVYFEPDEHNPLEFLPSHHQSYHAFKKMMQVFPFDGPSYGQRWTEEKWEATFRMPYTLKSTAYHHGLLASDHIFV